MGWMRCCALALPGAVLGGVTGRPPHASSSTRCNAIRSPAPVGPLGK